MENRIITISREFGSGGRTKRVVLQKAILRTLANTLQVVFSLPLLQTDPLDLQMKIISGISSSGLLQSLLKKAPASSLVDALITFCGIRQIV